MGESAFRFYIKRLVTYDKENNDGSEIEDLAVIFKYVDENWEFEFPGVKTTDNLFDRYGLFRIDD